MNLELMLNLKLRNPFCSSPANSNYQVLMHPSGDRQKTIECALFNEHRFAFYYWIKWNQENKTIPDLITMDWHQDLVYPEKHEKKELEKLNLDDLFEPSFYSWARLNPLNDNHILSATYLNQLNDIWVVCKQNSYDNWEDEKITDFQGMEHCIRKFPDIDSLLSKITKASIESIYFDIDLDYFTIENSTSNDKQFFTYVAEEEVYKIFNNESQFMKWLFQRMDGFTIALEPTHTGGISKSYIYLKLLNELLFDGDLLYDRLAWKHLVSGQ
jgi:hypothetical protein